MPSPLHYWPIHHREWLASSTIQSMSVTAEGIYFRLCLMQWEDGALADDKGKLRRLARATQREWREFDEYLDECFPLGPDGCRRNLRIEADRRAAAEKVAKNRENAQKGGRPRKQAETDAKPNGLPESNRTDSQPKPNPKSESKSEEKPVCQSLVTKLREIPGVARGRLTEQTFASVQEVLDRSPWVSGDQWLAMAERAVDGSVKVGQWQENGTATPTARQVLEKQIAFEKQYGHFPEPPKPSAEDELANPDRDPTEGVDFNIVKGKKVVCGSLREFDEEAWRRAR